MPSLHPAGSEPIAQAIAPPLRLRVVTDFDELKSLAPAWRNLLERSASADPMNAPTWLLNWWEIYHADRSLRVGLFYDGDRLVGIAPMCSRRVWYRPGIPMTRLEFLGSDMDQLDGVCSEYLRLIVLAGQEQRVNQAFARGAVEGLFGRWHELVLAMMDGSTSQPDHLLQAFGEQGLHGEKQTTMEAAFVALPSTWDAYLKSLSSNNRRYIKGTIRAFETWAGDDWKVESATTLESLVKGQEVLRDLHNHRWQDGDGLAGAFSRPRFTLFHQRYMAELFQEGRLHLTWLIVRGEAIAICYQIQTNGKIYDYQCGRKLDVPDGIRPGIVLTIQSLKRAIELGLREYDFLGGLVQYKQQLSKSVRSLVQVRMARSSPTEWLRRGAESVIGYARRFRTTVRTWRQMRAEKVVPGAQTKTSTVNES